MFDDLILLSEGACLYSGASPACAPLAPVQTPSLQTTAEKQNVAPSTAMSGEGVREMTGLLCVDGGRI